MLRFSSGAYGRPNHAWMPSLGAGLIRLSQAATCGTRSFSSTCGDAGLSSGAEVRRAAPHYRCLQQSGLRRRTILSILLGRLA